MISGNKMIVLTSSRFNSCLYLEKSRLAESVFNDLYHMD